MTTRHSELMGLIALGRSPFYSQIKSQRRSPGVNAKKGFGVTAQRQQLSETQFHQTLKIYKYWSSLVKDLVVSLQWLGSLLRRLFRPWSRNIHGPRCGQNKTHTDEAGPSRDELGCGQRRLPPQHTVSHDSNDNTYREIKWQQPARTENFPVLTYIFISPRNPPILRGGLASRCLPFAKNQSGNALLTDLEPHHS